MDFLYLQNDFPRISEGKIKESMFVGRQIKGLTKNRDFEENSNGVERAALKSFNRVVTEYLGIIKAENYRELDSELLRNYKALGCTMPLKIHFF